MTMRMRNVCDRAIPPVEGISSESIQPGAEVDVADHLALPRAPVGRSCGVRMPSYVESNCGAALQPAREEDRRRYLTEWSQDYGKAAEDLRALQAEERRKADIRRQRDEEGVHVTGRSCFTAEDFARRDAAEQAIAHRQAEAERDAAERNRIAGELQRQAVEQEIARRRQGRAS